MNTIYKKILLIISILVIIMLVGYYIEILKFDPVKDLINYCNQYPDSSYVWKSPQHIVFSINEKINCSGFNTNLELNRLIMNGGQ